MSTYQVTNNFVSTLVELANKAGVEYECFEGSLQDNFVFYDANKIKIENKSAKNIIVREVFLNTWSSGLELIMTDSDDEVEFFKKIFEQ